MSTSPVGPNSAPRPISVTSPFGPHPRSKTEARMSSNGAGDTPDAIAASTERDAQQRISQAQQNVTEAQTESNRELDQVHDQYSNRLEAETSREDDAIEKQRLKGYEALRNLKRQQEAEMHKTKEEGEREQAKLSNYYRDSNYATYRKGQADLDGLKATQGREMEHSSKSGNLDFTTAKADQDRKLADLRETQEHQFNALHTDSVDKYEKMKEQTIAANERANEHFQGTYKATLDQDQKSIDLLEGKANSEITQIRSDTSQKLAAYQERQGDPFYKLKDLGATLHEDGDKFVLTAKIPRHEQDHVNVSVSGNNLIVNGARRNEEKLDIGPGRMKSSASYQTYQESFPLPWPVDSHQLMKEFHGDTLIVTVPKQNQYAMKEPYKAPEPARLKAERPHFPGNLPTSESVHKGETEAEATSGTRPLT
jgi:HSP20 family molecular chaperone IbpA